MQHQNIDEEIKKLSRQINVLIWVLVLGIVTFVVSLNRDFFFGSFYENKTNLPIADTAPAVEEKKSTLWEAPDVETITDVAQKEKIKYGKELIAHTAKYLGPKGSVLQISNGMNCQNCHLDAGTKPWGNNYGSVASLYPKFRARSGTTENIYKRVNDCFERSLNGKALDTVGNEMQAIKAYIDFLGTNVEKGKKADGSGFKDLAFMDRAADPTKGELVYEQKCQSCHKADGQGQLLADESEYSFPPLWGKNSYNDGAGLYRITNFAKYVKYNMPLGANHVNPQLTDEEAWDVAAFVNSQTRPHISVPKDWPDKSKKPIDHPFGPYADKFTEKQHKYGPWKPIDEERKKKEAMAKKNN